MKPITFLSLLSELLALSACYSTNHPALSESGVITRPKQSSQDFVRRQRKALAANYLLSLPVS